LTDTTTKAPAYLVYMVRDGKEDDQGYWMKVGAAFRHKDGKGINIVLDALPIDGRLIVRQYEPKKKQSTL